MSRASSQGRQGRDGETIERCFDDIGYWVQRLDAISQSLLDFCRSRNMINSVKTF